MGTSRVPRLRVASSFCLSFSQLAALTSASSRAARSVLIFRQPRAWAHLRAQIYMQDVEPSVQRLTAFTRFSGGI